jgi:hypothetical protein
MPAASRNNNVGTRLTTESFPCGFLDSASYQAPLIKSARRWLQSGNAARRKINEIKQNLGRIATRDQLLLKGVEPFPSAIDSITKGMSI